MLSKSLQDCWHLFSFIFKIIILFHDSVFHHSVFQLTYLFFCLSYSAIDSFQCIFYFSYYMFISASLCFSSSKSFKNISCSILVGAFLFFLRYLLSLLWSFLRYSSYLDFPYLFFLDFILFLHRVPNLCHLVLSNFLWFSVSISQTVRGSPCFCCLPRGGRGCLRGFCRLAGRRDLFLTTGGCSWLLSIWQAELCQGVFIGQVCAKEDFKQPMYW